MTSHFLAFRDSQIVQFGLDFPEIFSEIFLQYPLLDLVVEQVSSTNSINRRLQLVTQEEIITIFWT